MSNRFFKGGTEDYATSILFYLTDPETKLKTAIDFRIIRKVVDLGPRRAVWTSLNDGKDCVLAEESHDIITFNIAHYYSKFHERLDAILKAGERLNKPAPIPSEAEGE